MSGHIELIIGPMFSGKTTELLRRYKRYKIAKKECIIIKHKLDNRYCEDSITTHDNEKIKTNFIVNSLSEVSENIKNIDIICIDEGQFFQDIHIYADLWANENKIVIISSLSGDFNRLNIGSLNKLIPIAEKIVKMNAICLYCGNLANFTKRLSNEKEIIVIGGIDKYIPVCRSCYFS